MCLLLGKTIYNVGTLYLDSPFSKKKNIVSRFVLYHMQVDKHKRKRKSSLREYKYQNSLTNKTNKLKQSSNVYNS